MSSALQQLSAFICNTTFSDLPPSLVVQAKRHILDTFGAALAGSDSDIFRTTLALVVDEQAASQSVIWGSDVVGSPRQAAWLNGIAAHMYELDDTGGCDHSGAVVLPAALAVLPLAPAAVSGQALIAAVVVGYDIGRRVLEACGGYSAHNGAGWHSTATCGVFAAAATAASLLRLSATQTASALAIAASFSGGLWGFIHDGSQTKKLHAGRAAEGGVLAALLASKNLTGPAHIFEDRWGGFLSTLAADSADAGALTRHLGSVWKLTRCSIKPYASCRGTHSAIDAIGMIMDRQQLLAEDIVAIDVALNPFLLEMCGGYDLDSLAAAQMSLPYALAARALWQDAGLSAYDDEKRHHPRVKDLLGRISLQIDPQHDNDEEPAIAITDRHGNRWQQQVKVALGAPDNPLSDIALVGKFRQLAKRVISADRAQAIEVFCLALDEQQEVSGLPGLLGSRAETF